MGHLICSGTTTKYLQNLVTGCMVSKSKIQIRLKKKKIANKPKSDFKTINLNY